MAYKAKLYLLHAPKQGTKHEKGEQERGRTYRNLNNDPRHFPEVNLQRAVNYCARAALP